jgi:hypothetical protein
MAKEATITNNIRIPASVLTGKGGKERSLPPTPSSSLLSQHCYLSAKTTRAPVFFVMLL